MPAHRREEYSNPPSPPPASGHAMRSDDEVNGYEDDEDDEDDADCGLSELSQVGHHYISHD